MSLFWRENPAFLDVSLKSLYNQTILPTEIIVVCEGDLPSELRLIVVKWIEKFTPEVLKIIPAGKAKGLPECLNVGLAAAKGDYIIRFDTDDYCMANRIEKQLNFFKNNPDVALLSANMEEYDSFLSSLIAIKQVPISHTAILKYAKWRNPFNHPSVAYKRKVAIQLGGYPIVGANEDYAFFCNFLVNGYKTANLAESIVRARTGVDFAKRRSGKKYLQGEIESLQYIHKNGFYSTYHYYIHIISKKIIRSLPLFFIRIIYKKILRQKC